MSWLLRPLRTCRRDIPAIPISVSALVFAFNSFNSHLDAKYEIPKRLVLGEPSIAPCPTSCSEPNTLGMAGRVVDGTRGAWPPATPRIYRDCAIPCGDRKGQQLHWK